MAPTAWNRLDDATQPDAVAGSLSIVALGEVQVSDLGPLTTRFRHLEQLVLDVPPRDPLAKHRAEFNRAVDASESDWMLIVREREQVDDALASEIGRATIEAKARGFRVRAIPYYAGKPLRIGPDDSEIRLFHRRYYLRYANKGEWDQLAVQGTVIRLENVLRSMTWPSAEEHRQYLARTAVPHSALRHTLLFLRDAAGCRTLDRNTLRYIWTEAGFDRG